MLASVFQLAARAPRSIVRMPLASVGSAAALGISAGRNSGSCTVMGKIYGQPKCRRLDRAGRRPGVLWLAIVLRIDCQLAAPFHIRRRPITLLPAYDRLVLDS